MRGDGESGSIRVSVEKIDSLINLVGELVITQAMLGQLGEQLDPSRHERLQPWPSSNTTPATCRSR